MSFATLNGTTVTKAVITVPWWGVWHALVTVDKGAVLSGPVTLVVGSVSFVGTVERGGTFVDSASYRIVGGANGWAKTIARGSYQGPLPRLETIAKDAARLCGETVVLAPGVDRRVGPFTRREDPASRVLSQLLPKQWRVDLAGVTQLGPRTETSALTHQVLDFDPGLGVAHIAAENIEGIEPGRTLVIEETTRTVRSVVHHIASGIRSELYL